MKSKTKRVHNNTTKKTRKLNSIKRTRKNTLIGGSYHEKGWGASIRDAPGKAYNSISTAKPIDTIGEWGSKGVSAYKKHNFLPRVIDPVGGKIAASHLYKGASTLVGSPGDSWNRIMGKDTDMCDLTADKTDTDERTMDETKIRRIVGQEHPFFKGEDKTFMAIIQKNIQLFCFENETPYIYDPLFPSSEQKDNEASNTSKDISSMDDWITKSTEKAALKKAHKEETAYYKFCESMFDKCLKTPPLFYEIILDAISEETIYKNFQARAGDAKDIIKDRITEAHKTLETNVETSIIDGKKESSNQTDAKIMAILSDEIKYHIANFIVNVLIKSMIDYKEKASEGLDPKVYTGKIKMEKYIVKLIIQIISSGGAGDSGDSGGADNNNEAEDNNTIAQQSGGANNGASTMSVSELKAIDVNKLKKGLKDCASREKLKKGFEDKQAEGPTEEEANYGEESMDDGAPLSAKPWFLYVVLGVLAFTTTIELGIFDAPQCLTHTFI
jgi:hypothetical protein